MHHGVLLDRVCMQMFTIEIVGLPYTLSLPPTSSSKMVDWKDSMDVIFGGEEEGVVLKNSSAQLRP